MAAKGKGGTAKQKLSVVSKGFGAPKDSPLLEMGKRLAKNLGKQSGKNPRLWLDFGAAAAEQEEYADARMILEAGLAECGGSSDLLVSALGQMRRSQRGVAREGEHLCLHTPRAHVFAVQCAAAAEFLREGLGAQDWRGDSVRVK